MFATDKEYVELYPNTDTIIKDENINLNTETGAKVSRQDYININVSTEEKQENMTINQNNNIGLSVIKKDYIKIEEVQK